jgi:hypothetical protein
LHTQSEAEDEPPGASEFVGHVLSWPLMQIWPGPQSWQVSPTRRKPGMH